MECKICGNKTDFRETTTTKWIVDEGKKREEKLSETTTFCCARCGNVL